MKIRQNTKPIALLISENWPILAIFHSTIKFCQVAFLMKIRQNTKPIALLFGENWPNLATFHSTIKICQVDFW